MAGSEEELKSLLMKVKESENVGLKLNIQKTKIMAFGPITSWEIEGETVETVSDFIFWGSKLTADGDCSPEIKRHLLLGREVMYIDHNGLADKYPGADRKYDGVLLAGLADEIRESDKDKLLIVLHCSTSHGPKYFDKYPAEFNRFTPVCTNVEVSSADKEGLVNAYDNTILYTDYLVHSVIETLRQVSDRRCCMIYVSDHGESLGENDLFMHGTMPRSLAPRQQFEIPFIVWENDSATRTKELESVRQFYVFHTVMNWFGMQGPVYNEEMNLFEPVA